MYEGADSFMKTRKHTQMMRVWVLVWAVFGGLLVGSAGWAEESMEDPEWKSYVKVSGVSGNLNSIGSDTLNNLMTLWAEGFRKQYPNVKIQIEGKGSSTAPPALIEGTAQLGPMSRKMKGKEMDGFEAKYGYKPAAFPVAIDALGVYVNQDNPIPGLSLPQVDAIFSKTRRLGAKEDIKTWGQLGVNGGLSRGSISLYGRNSASGTYGFFKDRALQGGDYKDEVKEQPGSASVVQGITGDRFGIGYSGVGYRTSGVRLLPLGMKEGEAFVDPSYENASKGAYPLSRFLFIYIHKVPNQPLSPIVREFLKYVYSREGQRVVIKDGYYPIRSAIIEKQLAHLR